MTGQGAAPRRAFAGRLATDLTPSLVHRSFAAAGSAGPPAQAQPGQPDAAPEPESAAFIQRVLGDELLPELQPAGPALDIDQLTDRVYRRWQDELRLESARGGWFS